MKLLNTTQISLVHGGDIQGALTACETILIAAVIGNLLGGMGGLVLREKRNDYPVMDMAPIGRMILGGAIGGGLGFVFGGIAATLGFCTCTSALVAGGLAAITGAGTAKAL